MVKVLTWFLEILSAQEETFRHLIVPGSVLHSLWKPCFSLNKDTPFFFHFNLQYDVDVLLHTNIAAWSTEHLQTFCKQSCLCTGGLSMGCCQWDVCFNGRKHIHRRWEEDVSFIAFCALKRGTEVLILHSLLTMNGMTLSRKARVLEINNACNLQLTRTVLFTANLHLCIRSITGRAIKWWRWVIA